MILDNDSVRLLSQFINEVSELNEEESLYLGLLKTKHENTTALEKWMNEYIKNVKNPLYLVIMNVLAEANPNDIVEVYKSMGKAQLSNENMDFILDMMKKLELDKKLKEEGKKEGDLKARTIIAKNLIGILDNEIISEKTGLPIEDIEKLIEIYKKK